MKLFGNMHSACTRTALMGLAETGFHAEFVPVDLSSGQHKSPAHLARHPFGRIPVLEDQGLTLYEVRAILRYLAARNPAAGLVPDNIAARALMDQWISVDACYFTPAAYDIVVQVIYVPMFGGNTDAALVDSARTRVMEVYDVLEAQLTKTPYLAGDNLSLADICFVQYTESLFQALGTGLFDRHRYLKVWRQSLLSRPSAQVPLSEAA